MSRFKFLRALFVSLPMFLLSVSAAVVDATWNSATDIPVTAASYTATGNTVRQLLRATWQQQYNHQHRSSAGDSKRGADWQLSQPTLVGVYFANAEAGGLGGGQGLHLDAPKLTKNPATGLFKLRIGIQKSTDLQHFTPFPMTAPQTTISGDGKLEFEFASPDSAAFYRLLAE